MLLMQEPNFDDPINYELVNLYKQDREEYMNIMIMSNANQFYKCES